MLFTLIVKLHETEDECNLILYVLIIAIIFGQYVALQDDEEFSQVLIKPTLLFYAACVNAFKFSHRTSGVCTTRVRSLAEGSVEKRRTT